MRARHQHIWDLFFRVPHIWRHACFWYCVHPNKHQVILLISTTEVREPGVHASPQVYEINLKGYAKIFKVENFKLENAWKCKKMPFNILQMGTRVLFFSLGLREVGNHCSTTLFTPLILDFQYWQSLNRAQKFSFFPNNWPKRLKFKGHINYSLAYRYPTFNKLIFRTKFIIQKNFCQTSKTFFSVT